MNWIKTYNELETKPKRQLKQRIKKECELSDKTFYIYLAGKQPRRAIGEKIQNIVTSFAAPSVPFRSDECRLG